MLMFRVLRHLLPSGLAWRATVDKALRRYLDGLSTSYADARAYVDDVYDDLFPSRTRWLSRWERQFGLSGRGSTADRVANLQAAWQAQGGQSPRYIHDLLRTAGFDVCIHDWWTTDVSPRTPFDPRDVAIQPAIGAVQASDDEPTEPQCLAEATATLDDPQPQCNAFLANYTKYLVNKTLRNVTPPPLPSSSALWPFFWYLSGSPHSREIPAILDGAGRDTLERLALKVGPTHQWIVTNIDWVDPPEFFDEPGTHRWISRSGVAEGPTSTWDSSRGDVVSSFDSTVLVPRLFERIVGVRVDLPNAWTGQPGDVSEELFDAFEGAHAWSIAACLRRGSGGSFAIQLLGDGSEAVRFSVLSNGNFRIQTEDASGFSSLLEEPIPDYVTGDAVSLVATYDGAGTFVLYANGSQIDTASVTHRTISTLDLMRIEYDFDFADICLVDRVLESAEVAAYGAYCDALYRPRSEALGGVVERWRASVLADGAVSLWPGDKGAFDLNTPAVGTEPESSATLIDSTYRGVEFNDDDALDVAATGSLQTAVEGSFSLAWLGHAPEGPSENQVIFCDHSVDPSSVEIRLFEGDLEFFRREDGITGGSGFVSGGPDDSELHSWVATYDNSTGRFSFFVDGLKIGEDTNGSSPGLAISIDRFIVGNAPSATRPFGALADVTVFDSALSDDDAQSIGEWLMWLYSSCDLPGEEGGMGDFEFLLIG